MLAESQEWPFSEPWCHHNSSRSTSAVLKQNPADANNGDANACIPVLAGGLILATLPNERYWVTIHLHSSHALRCVHILQCPIPTWAFYRVSS